MQKYQKTLHLSPLNVLYDLNKDIRESTLTAAPDLAQSYQFPTGLIMQVSVFSADDNNVGFVAYLWDANSNLINMSDAHTDYLGKYTVTNPYTQDVYTLILDDNCKGWITPNTTGYVLKWNKDWCKHLYMPKSEVQKLNILLQTPVEAHGKLMSKSKTLWKRNVTVDNEGYWYMRISIEADSTEYYPYVQLQVLTLDGDEYQVGTNKATENKPANILGAYELMNISDVDLPTDFYIGTTE
jgi:hypothetical protein